MEAIVALSAKVVQSFDVLRMLEPAAFGGKEENGKAASEKFSSLMVRFSFLIFPWTPTPNCLLF